jgi:hypothetical protein
MKLMSSIHNRKTKRYVTYYTLVLVVVVGTVVYTTITQVHQSPLQSIGTFFEGFFSLFMLSRSEIVEKSFVSHLSHARTFMRTQLLLPKL